MSKLLTIVIPAYNMEQYISRCLDSFNRVHDVDDLEILVINDGSKDKTLLIAREFEQKYPKILKVIDKPNGGWGSAINKGLELASGKYFKILDSDDWFDAKAFVEFIQLLRSLDVDLIATSFSYEYASGSNKNDIYPATICNRIIPFDVYLKENNYDKHLPMATITYKTELLQTHHIHLADRYYADIDYHLTPLIFVKTIYFSQINLYKYWIGRARQSTSIAGYNAHLDDYLAMSKKIVTFYAAHACNCDCDIKIAFENDMLKILQFSYYLLLSTQFSGKNKDSNLKCRELDKFIKDNIPCIYKRLNNVKVKRLLPYIFIWRTFGINVLKLGLWI